LFKELEKLDVKEVPRWVATYVRNTLKELLDREGYRGRRGRRGTRGGEGEGGGTGPPGKDGASGTRGLTGDTGPHGDDGDGGIQGKRGIQGVAGLTGRSGHLGHAGTKGDKGDKGDQGQVGPVPRHKWEGTRLSFEQPNGKFGQSINLQGQGGGRGASGRSGGASANPGFSSITLVGTDLVFARDTAGPLGPDITVDLSGLNTGGGFAGLGPWRYRTSTGTSPSTGRLNFNNVDPELATELYLNETNDNAEDLANFLALLEAGDLLYIQDKGNADNFILVEVASNTDNGPDITIGIANVAAQGAAIANNAQVTVVMSIAGGGTGSVVTALVTAGDGDEITLTQTTGGDQVADTSDFLWKPGKAGGQSAIGGLASLEELRLRGSTDADLGTIVMQSPVEFESISLSGRPYVFNYDATEGYIFAFVGGGLNMSGTIDFINSTFIYESFRGAPIITTGVNPGFAAYTVLQALPNLVAGSAVGHNPLNPIVLNAGPRLTNPFSGSRTTATATGVNFSPTLAGTVFGANMNVTNISALICAPKFSTVLGSAIDFGTVRGIWCQNPALSLFAPGAGAESMTAYYGVDVAAIPFGGNVTKNAIRSALVAASNTRFLNNIGTAASEFGAGTIHFNDNIAAHFGNTLAAPDAGIYFDGTHLVLDTQITGANASKVQVLHGIIVEADIFPVSDFIRRATSTNLLLSSWRLTGLTTGDMADGFGTALFWSIEDDTSGRVNIAFQSAEREGADNSGRYRLRVYTAGVANEIFNAGADGFAHVATNLGFYGTAPIAKQLAVPVTSIGIHAALVALGLIT